MVVTGTAILHHHHHPPSTPWFVAQRTCTSKVVLPPHPPPPVHPRSTSPSPIPPNLTPHLLLLSEQSQPAIACAILCLVSKIRQRIAAYKYSASPDLAAAFPTFRSSTVSVYASGILWPPHGPDHQALVGCDCETDICCSIEIAKFPPRPAYSLAAAWLSCRFNRPHLSRIARLDPASLESSSPRRPTSKHRSRIPTPAYSWSHVVGASNVTGSPRSLVKDMSSSVLNGRYSVPSTSGWQLLPF